MTETHLSRLGKCSMCSETVKIKQVIEDREVIEQVKIDIGGEIHDCKQLQIQLEVS